MALQGKLKMNCVFFYYCSLFTFSIYSKVDGMRGWFIRLCYGNHLSSDSEGMPLEDFSLGGISVPVKLVEVLKGGKESSCYVVGGFHGIHSSEDGKHRPVMSFAVFEEVEDESGSNINKKGSDNVPS
jgi:hypothetical protein